MAGRKAGDIWVAIHPDAAFFGTQTRAALKKATAGIRAEIPVTADTKPAITSIEALRARMAVLNDNLAKLRLTADGKPAEAAIVAVQAKMAALAKTMTKLAMGADTKKLDAQIVAKLAEMAKLRQSMTGLKMDADDKALTAKILGLERQAYNLKKSLDKGTIKGDISVTAAQAKLDALRAKITQLRAEAKDITLVASNVSALRDVGVLKAEIAALQKQARDIRLGGNTDAAGLLAAEAGLLGLEAAAAKLAPALETGDAALGVLGKALVGTGRGWGFLTRSIALFGGGLNRVLPVVASTVAIWHVLADAVIELGAVWIPATLAVGAFAVAASDAAVEVQRRMQAMHTELDATGRSVPGLTSGMEALHDAVRPQVYQLFGEALTVMKSRTGTFAQVAKQTGTVLDQLGARIVFAVTSSNKLGTSTTQLSGFWKTAITDVSKLGDSIGNVFGIFGNFFKAIPGFAAGLLTIGDDFTKILESASAAAVPVLKWILLLHGYILYTGLAVTATLAFIGGLANLARQFFTFAAGSVLAGVGALKSFGSALVTLGLKIAAWGESIIKAEGAAAKFGAALAPLAANPMLWVTAAALALGALVFEIVRSKNAAQQFNDTMQQTITNAGLSSVVSVIQSAQAATTAKLAAATGQLNQQVRTNTVVNAGRAGSLNSNGAAIQNLASSTNDYRKGLSQLSGQQQLVTTRFAGLTAKYGSSTAALGLLNAAGITGAQITDTQGHAWAQALIQIDSTVQAYTAMGTQAGTLGNDLDVLGRTVTDQYQAVQKLNQAWSSFISDVTGTQGSFDTVAQGFLTLADHTGKLTFNLGKLKASYADNAAAITAQGALASATASVATAQNSLNRLQNSGNATALQLTAAHSRLTAAQDRLTAAQLNLSAAQNQGKAAIDALTPAGIALNQAFGDQVVNIDKLFGSWRTAGLANNLFTAGVKDAISPLVKYANGSQEATAQLVALAQEAGYQGPISMAALTKWLGNTHGATQKLKDITNQATSQEALLTGAMQNQGNIIASQLLGDINNAILAYANVKQAVTDYGTAVAHSGKNSDDARAKMVKAITAIVTAEVAMGDNANQMAAIVAKTFGISMPAAIALVKKSMGDLASKTAPGAQKAFETFAEVGLGKSQSHAHDLWDEIVTRLGPKLNALGDLAGGKAKKTFIDWAMNALHLSKEKATELWKETDVLQQHINNLHGKTVKVGVNFVGSGSGSIAFKESIPGVTLGPSSGGLLGFHAAGGMISGGQAGKDSVLGMLMPGEVVVPAKMVQQGAVDHLRGQLPGFAEGGAVSAMAPASRIFSTGQPFMEKAEASFGRQVEAAYARAVTAKFKKDMDALSGGGPAIAAYARSWLGKIPYVFGGTSFSGDDCSGFTQAVYAKFGIHAPRTSEAQYAWATRSGPVPGGLAFYVSPAGGPPPGHVAIVQDAGSVISQGGGLGPKIESLRFMPLMGTGVPKGGFPASAGGGGNAAIGGAGGPSSASAAQAQAYARSRLAAYGWGASQWPPLDNLWNGESGWSRLARNASSGAYGIPQALPGSKMGAAANPPTSSAAAQVDWGLGYIKSAYGSPGNAWGLWLGRSPHWYARGGLVPGMAAGGTVAGLRSRLAGEQKGERAKFSGLEHSFAAGPAKFRTKTVMSELAVLARHQAAEQLAYAQLSGSGLTDTRLHHFGVTARAAERTAGDQALNRLPGGHPGFAHDLRKYLHDLSVTASGSVPSGGGSGGGGGPGNIKVPVPVLGSFFKDTAALRSALAGAEKGEKAKYFGLHHSYETGPAKYLTKTVRSELATLGKRQSAELSAYAALSGTGLVPGNLGKLGSAAKAETRTAQDQALMRGGPGGHPLWDADLRRNLARIISVTNAGLPGATGTGAGGLPVLGPVAHTYGGDVGVADTIGAFLHQAAMPFARGGMATSFDQGGWLQPGTTLAYNGTGKPEPVGGAGAVNVTVQLEWAGRNGGDELMALLRKAVRVRGGGNVQRALGTPGTVSGSNTWRSG